MHGARSKAGGLIKYSGAEKVTFNLLGFQFIESEYSSKAELFWARLPLCRPSK